MIRSVLLPAAFAALGAFAAPPEPVAFVYKEAGGRQLSIRLWTPAGEGPFPVVLEFPGGRWDAPVPPVAPRADFLAAGIAHATVEVRRAGEGGASLRAILSDSKDAVRFFRAPGAAERTRVDPARIGVAGTLGGGHLAALLGVTGGLGDRLAPDAAGDVSSAVRAVCARGAPLDLEAACRLARLAVRYAAEPGLEARRGIVKRMLDEPIVADKAREKGVPTGLVAFATDSQLDAIVNKSRAAVAPLAEPVLALAGVSRRPEDADAVDAIARCAPDVARASPLAWVSGAYARRGVRFPPFLLLHSRGDPLVPWRQSQAFSDALRRTGSQPGLAVYPGSGAALPPDARGREVRFFAGAFGLLEKKN